MTARTPIRETPSKLAFGTEVVIPIEVGVSSLRRAHYDEGINNDKLKLNLNFLAKVRDEAALRIARYQQKMEKYHNQMVKLRRFNPGDMVLQRVSQATRDPAQRKLGPTWEGPYKAVCYSRKESYCLKDPNGKPLPRP